MIKRKFKQIIWPLVIVVAAMAMFQYLKSTKPKSPQVEASERAWPVKVMPIQIIQASPMQVLYARVEASQLVKVTAPVAAQVSALSVLEGEKFEAGQALISLDADEVALTLKAALADLNEAKALVNAERMAQEGEKQRLEQEQTLLELKRADLSRNKQLVARNLASESAVDMAQEALARQELAWINAHLVVEQQGNKLAQLQARLERANTAYQRAQLNAQRAKVVAPYAGRVAKVLVSQGDQVSVNTPLMQYYGFEHLQLRAKLPLLLRYQVEQALNQAQVLKGYWRNQSHEYAFKLSRLAGESSAAGVDALFDVSPDLSYLRPGELLELRLQLPVLDQVVAVPYSALYGQNRVYVVSGERLNAREVQILGDVEVDGERWALVRGALAAGESLSVTHLPNAIDGLLVSVSLDQGR